MICSDEGLTVKMSAFESLYGGQFTLSSQLIKPTYVAYCEFDSNQDRSFKASDNFTTRNGKTK